MLLIAVGLQQFIMDLLPELELPLAEIAFPERLVIKIKFMFSDQLFVQEVLQSFFVHVPVDIFPDT